MRKTLFAILLCGVMALGLTGCGKSSVEDAKKDLQESQEKYRSAPNVSGAESSRGDNKPRDL